jgi:GT2 family glycosyltransferase
VPSRSHTEVSIIIPAHNAGPQIALVLRSIAASRDPPCECIVVDDASTDDTAALAASFPVRVIQLETRRGPAHARNEGARLASGGVLLFLDADVTLHPGTIRSICARFEADPALGALFGAYDDAPADPGLVSRYRNLLHCYVHRHSSRCAGTFWSGCGAIRRQAFAGHGGFNHGYDVPSVEDIELGMRLRRDGVKITLAPEIQVKHLKRWTLWKMLRTDVVHRGIPWTRLILASGHLPNDLNLTWTNRASAALLVAAGALLPAAGLGADAFFLAPAAFGLLAVVGFVNRDFYRFLARRGGWRLALAGVGLHLAYFGCCVVAFAAGFAIHHWKRLTATAPETVCEAEPE